MGELNRSCRWLARRQCSRRGGYCSSGLGRSSPPRLSILSPPARPPACPYVGHASALTQRGRRSSRGSRRETLPRSGAC